MKEFEIDFNNFYLLEKGKFPLNQLLEKKSIVLLKEILEDENLTCLAKVVKVEDGISYLKFQEWIE